MELDLEELVEGQEWVKGASRALPRARLRSGHQRCVHRAQEEEEEGQGQDTFLALLPLLLQAGSEGQASATSM